MKMLRKILIITGSIMLLMLMAAVSVNAETTVLSNGKRVWANSEEMSNPAVNLVDGNMDNNWAALDGGYGKEFTIDLGAVYELSEMRLYPKESRAYKYKIYVSTDGASVNQLVVDKSDNTFGGTYYTDDLSGIQARYVRVYISGAVNNKWVSFYEAEVYGDSNQIGKINCALGKNVINISDEQSSEGNYASNLVDGTMSGHWAAEGTANATIDLGEPFYISSTEIVPEAERGYGYTIEVSYDNKNYVTIVDKSTNSAGGEVIADNFSPVEARYVRLSITRLPAGVSWTNIKEFSVFGEKSGVDLSVESGYITFEEYGSGLQVTLNGISSATKGRVMTIIVAAFDGDRMTGYKAETFEIPTYGEDISYTLEVTSEELGGINGKTVEAFVWDDLGNMKSQTATSVYGG